MLDAGLGVADVLPDIAKEVGSRATIMADGCIRTGYDVLKGLVLVADVALIVRPLARMSITGGGEALSSYIDYVRKELRNAMIMTGCDSISEVSGSILNRVSMF